MTRLCNLGGAGIKLDVEDILAELEGGGTLHTISEREQIGYLGLLGCLNRLAESGQLVLADRWRKVKARGILSEAEVGLLIDAVAAHRNIESVAAIVGLSRAAVSNRIKKGIERYDSPEGHLSRAWEQIKISNRHSRPEMVGASKVSFRLKKEYYHAIPDGQRPACIRAALSRYLGKREGHIRRCDLCFVHTEESIQVTTSVEPGTLARIGKGSRRSAILNAAMEELFGTGDPSLVTLTQARGPANV